MRIGILYSLSYGRSGFRSKNQVEPTALTPIGTGDSVRGWNSSTCRFFLHISLSLDLSLIAHFTFSGDYFSWLHWQPIRNILFAFLSAPGSVYAWYTTFGYYSHISDSIIIWFIWLFTLIAWYRRLIGMILFCQLILLTLWWRQKRRLRFCVIWNLFEVWTEFLISYCIILL